MYLFRKYLVSGMPKATTVWSNKSKQLSAHPPGGKPDYYGRNGPDQGPIPKPEQTHSKTPYTACQITISECQRVPESATPCKTEQSHNQYYTFSKTNSFKPSNKFQLWQSKRTKTIHRNRLRFILILTKKPCSSVIPKTGKWEVVSDMKMEQGKAHLVTTQPIFEKPTTFYQRKDSHFIANFMANFRAQAADPNMYPSFHRTFQTCSPGSRGKLFRLADNPKRCRGPETSRQYRTSQAKPQ